MYRAILEIEKRLYLLVVVYGVLLWVLFGGDDKIVCILC